MFQTLTLAVALAAPPDLDAAAALALAAAARPARPAAAVTACPCGPSCPAGGNCAPCLCVQPVSTPAADPQRKAYDALVRSLKPGQTFVVYVGRDAGMYESDWVRWDAYPNARGRTRVDGVLAADGCPYELITPQGPAPAAPVQPLASWRPITVAPFGARFGGGCPPGGCR